MHHPKVHIYFGSHKKIAIAVACFVLLLGMIEGIILLTTHAATPVSVIEAESGTRTTNAKVVSDTSASGGSAIMFSGSTVTPPPTGGGGGGGGDSSLPLLGVYNGGVSGDDGVKTLFGRYPDLSTSYYQLNQVGNIVNAEKTRVNKGIRPVITITSKGTQYLVDAANKSGAGWTWLQSYVSALASLASYAQSKNVAVYATLDHEYEVKVNHGQITGQAANDAVYAKALSNFFSLMNAQAPYVTTLYWYGGFDTADIGTIGSDLTVKPDMYTLDPYSGSGDSATQTFQAMGTPKISWLKGQAWYKAAPKPYGFTEYGARHSDADMATYFFKNDRAQAKALGLSFAIFFDRDVSPDVINITPSTYPKSVAAFSNSLAGN